MNGQADETKDEDETVIDDVDGETIIDDDEYDEF